MQEYLSIKKLLNKGLYTLKVLEPMDSSSEPPEQHKPLRACCYYSFNAFDLCIAIDERHHEFINKISLQSVPTRYPEDFAKLSR